jgi:hypothetical protein
MLGGCKTDSRVMRRKCSMINTVREVLSKPVNFIPTKLYLYSVTSAWVLRITEKYLFAEQMRTLLNKMYFFSYFLQRTAT